jgi:hypothetical protein
VFLVIFLRHSMSAAAAAVAVAAAIAAAASGWENAKGSTPIKHEQVPAGLSCGFNCCYLLSCSLLPDTVEDTDTQTHAAQLVIIMCLSSITLRVMMRCAESNTSTSASTSASASASVSHSTSASTSARASSNKFFFPSSCCILFVALKASGVE